MHDWTTRQAPEDVTDLDLRLLPVPENVLQLTETALKRGWQRKRDEDQEEQ